MERWRLVAGHVPDPLALALLIACLGAAAIEAALALRSGPVLPRRTRLGLFALRLLGLLALLAVGLELTLAQETVRPVGPRVAVLVDASASMALADAERPGGATTPRIDRLRELWTASAPARAAWRERGLAVDMAGYEREMDAQRERARAASRGAFEMVYENGRKPRVDTTRPKADSPWTTDYGAMAAKTAIRRFYKDMDLTEFRSLATAIEVDDAYAIGSRIPAPTAITGDPVKPPEQLSPTDEWGDDVLFGTRDEDDEQHETIVDASASERE